MDWRRNCLSGLKPFFSLFLSLSLSMMTQTLPIIWRFLKRHVEQKKKDDPKTFFFVSYPTNNALLITFRLSSDSEILLLSTDWAYKLAQNVQRRVCNVHVFRLSFHFACHRCWLGSYSKKKVKWHTNLFFQEFGKKMSHAEEFCSSSSSSSSILQSPPLVKTWQGVEE